MNSIAFEPGSYRDRSNRVFYFDGKVRRSLRGPSIDDWEALSAALFFHEMMARGKIVFSRRISDAEAVPEGWAAALEHETIPFISYPYEWSFGMLKDAALLELELLEKGIAEGIILKDCSSYNVQWRGIHPVFIDISSFTRLKPGDAWAGYQQFCRMFLFPLMLKAYKGIPHQKWLRGYLDGIPVEDCVGLFSFMDIFKSGVFKDVFLQSKFEAAYADTRRVVRSELAEAGFSRELILRNVRRLFALVTGLQWNRRRSEWSEYSAERNYSENDYRAKLDFVKSVAEIRRRTLVWDLGCNTGDFSRIASDHADTVVSMDGDPWVIEILYRNLKNENRKNVIPLVMNIVDPSPSQGWRGMERRSLLDRGKPDLILSLALIHHLVIGAHVPLDDILTWFSSLGAEMVMEFVDKNDSMVKRLLRNKDDIYSDYDKEKLEITLKTLFHVERILPLESGTRTLYHLKPR